MNDGGAPESSAIIEAAERLKRQTERFSGTETGLVRALQKLDTEHARVVAELGRLQENYQTIEVAWADLREKVAWDVEQSLSKGNQRAEESRRALEGRYDGMLAQAAGMTLDLERFEERAQQALDRQSERWAQGEEGTRAVLQEEIGKIPQAVTTAGEEAARAVRLRVEAQLNRIEGALIAARQTTTTLEGQVQGITSRLERLEEDRQSLRRTQEQVEATWKAAAARMTAETAAEMATLRREISDAARPWWRRTAGKD